MGGLRGAPKTETTAKWPVAALNLSAGFELTVKNLRKRQAEKREGQRNGLQ